MKGMEEKHGNMMIGKDDSDGRTREGQRRKGGWMKGRNRKNWEE
jgi:hypothetical protein